MRSPQFQQTLKLLTAALRSGQVEAVLQSLGLAGGHVTAAGGVQAFLRAIQAEADKNKPEAKETTMDVDDGEAKGYEYGYGY